MATGVLSFLRGIDLTGFPLGETENGETEQLKDLQKVRWLKLARCGLKARIISILIFLFMVYFYDNVSARTSFFK